MAAGMKAEDDLGSLGMFESDALGSDGNTAVGSGFEQGSDAPNIWPPGAARGRPQNGAFLFPGQIPGSLCGEFKFAVGFPGVAMEAQGLDVPVGFGQVSDALAGEIGRQPLLPELVFAFDFAFGLRGWSVKETNVIKPQGRAQLGQSVRGLGEENGVVIDIELQGPAVGQESSGQEIQVGQKEFSIIEFGPHKKAAAIIEHIEHGKVEGAEREPMMGRGVQLPEFADLRALPAAHRSQRLARGHAMSMAVLQRPVAHLSAIELEVVKAQNFRSGEAVRARRRASQAFAKEIDNGLRPSRGVIAARAARRPGICIFVSASVQITAEQNVEPAARKAKLVGRFRSAQSAFPQAFKNMPDESGRVPMQKLLILFRTAEDRRRASPSGQSFRLPSLRSGFLKAWPEGLCHWSAGADVLFC
jgi:hypothetical protein